jgi:multiple antibiotic resistance protein
MMFSAFLPVFFTIFIVLDPIGMVPLYIGLTSHIPRERRKGIIRKAVFISFGVLVFFVVLGNHILGLLRIDPGAFYIAGGIMLFIISLDMLFGRPSKSKISERERSDPPSESGGGDEGISVAVFPLAIPMLAGPGTITAIILFTGRGDVNPLVMTGMLLVSLAVVLGIVWAALSASDFILRFLGTTGVSVFVRIMGLLLSGMSVQFVYDGMARLGLISGGL